MAEPRASVVIPTLNGGPRFQTCLEAVAAQELAGGFEIIVVDSGSVDGTTERAKPYARVIRIQKHDFNHGRTRNLAIAEARAPAVALLVQDAVPLGRDWLRALVEAVASPGVAGAYSRQAPRPGCPPFLRARLERWSASQSVREEKRLAGRSELLSLPVPERIRRLSFDNVSSCLKREVWEKHPFPERRFGEDAAWAREVLLAGYSIVYEPDSAVEHSHANSLWYEFKRVFLDHRNWREVAEGGLFNNVWEVGQASWNGTFERWAELSGPEAEGLSGLYWRAYAAPYSYSQNLAQYLGSRSRALVRAWPAWSRVEDWLSQGV